MVLRWLFKKAPAAAPRAEAALAPNASGDRSTARPEDTAAAIKAAVAHHVAGRLAEGEDLYRKVLASAPNNFDALQLLGVLKHAQGDHRQAIDLISRAVAIDATYPPAYFNLGNVYGETDRVAEAIECYRRAIALDPSYVDAHFNLANALHRLGRLDEALISFKAVISRKPDFAPAHNGAGIVYGEQRLWSEAVSSFQRAVSIDPTFADAHYNLGNALAKEGRWAESLRSYRTTFTLVPEYALARWAYTMAQIPLVYDVNADPAASRRAFSRELSSLTEWFSANPARIAHGFDTVGSQQPFYLAYQEEDNRELLSRYGELCARLMKAWHDGRRVAAPVARRRDKIAVGVVSAHFCDHSVWSALIQGLLLQIDPARFDLDLFYLGGVQDRQTQLAKSRASHFAEGRKSLAQWVETIESRNLDVLVYPEIGMDPMTAKLASLRLAPVQVITWGHPQTSGLPTLDYFLSAEDFEPDDAQGGQSGARHYSERLIALPHLGCSYAPSSVTPVAPDLAAMGVDTDAPLLLCPGLPFKYAPQHDHVLVDIARRLGRCQIIFVTAARLENLSAKLHERLGRAFAAAGLDANAHVKFIPWQTREGFYGLMQSVDVFLDTIGFSGFNTAMQAVECGLPIVTRKGRFMRGRLASGILKRMGLDELVAQSDEDYVALAARLARERDYSREIRGRIAAARADVFDDSAPVGGLEEFLGSVARR